MAATVTVAKELYKDHLLYRKTMGSVYRLKDGTSYLFRTASGASCNTKGINGMSKRAWEKAGLKPINFTTLRKLTTVTGKEEDSIMAEEISHHSMSRHIRN